MKRRFVAVGVIGTVVLVLLAAWFFSGGDLNEYAGRREAVRAVARAEGLPLSLSEVDTRGALARSLNAAPAIAAAHTATEAVGRDYEAPEDGGIDALRSSLEEFEEAIAAWSTAAGFDDCDFERDWERGVWLPFPELAQIKEGATLLLADARLGRLEDDLERWKERVAEARQLARHSATDPAMKAGMVRLEIDEMVLSEIAEALQAGSGSKEAIEACQAALDEPYGVEDILYGLRFECASVYAVLDEYHTRSFRERFDNAIGSNPGTQYPLHMNADAANEAAWLETIVLVQTKIAEHSDDWPGLLNAFQGFASEHFENDRPSHTIVRQFFFDPEQLVASYCKAEALRRIMFVSAVAFDHHRMYREFPKRLPVLGTMATDPFSGRPFLYDNLGLGFTLYSVGPDRIDGGGPSGPGFATEGGDIGFQSEQSVGVGDSS